MTKTLLTFCILANSSVALAQDSLFQMVNYIWVNESKVEAFEENMLVDRKGLAQATVDEGVVLSWHFFRNLDDEGANYLQVITLTGDQKRNPALPVEIERVAERVLGDKKQEVISSGQSLIDKMEEEWWAEIERMWLEVDLKPFSKMMIGYMQSIPSTSIEYQDMERRIWQPAIEVGMNDRLLTGWTMASIQENGSQRDYNYVAIDAFETEKEMRSVDWNGWLVRAHPDSDAADLNAETERVRTFVRARHFELIDWAGKQ